MEKSVEIALQSIIANIANHVDGEEFLSSLAKSFEKDAKGLADNHERAEAGDLERLERAVKQMIHSRHG